MTDIILSSFISLFALFGKEEQVDEQRAKDMLVSYLRRHFGIRNIDIYLDLYSDMRMAYEMSDDLDTAATVSSICSTLHGNIRSTEESLLLLRLMEFCSDDGLQAEAIFKTMAQIFGISEQHYNCYLDYVNNKPSDYIILHHLNHFDGVLKTLLDPSTGLLLFTYMGHDTVLLNDIPVLSGTYQVWLQSSVLKSASGKPVYYSSIISSYGQGDQATQSVTFCGRDINFRFPNSDNGMHDLSFTLHNGELLAIMGGSGTGKTTLLSLLNGTLVPQQGSITINGHSITEPATKALIGFVPQDDLLIEELTVYQNLWYTAKLCFEGMSDADLDRRVMKTLKDLGLDAAKDLKVGSPIHKYISGGQRKRLNIALELIREPAVLFLDEPTSGLSSADTEKVINLLKEQTLKGKLIVVNIHQPSSDVYKLFDRLWLLDKGGYPVFDGNPIDAVTYFKEAANYADAETSACPTCGNVNPEIVLNIIDEKALNSSGELSDDRKTTPQEWHELYVKEQQKKGLGQVKVSPVPASDQKKPGALKQFFIFLRRTIHTKITNTQYMAIALLQAPLLALVCGYLTRFAPPEGYSVMNNKNLVSYFFMAVIVATFTGMSGSAEEIIKDRALLKRERFLHLSYGSYIWSKIVFMAALSLVQTLLFILVGNTMMGIHGLFFTWWGTSISASPCCSSPRYCSADSSSASLTSRPRARLVTYPSWATSFPHAGHTKHWLSPRSRTTTTRRTTSMSTVRSTRTSSLTWATSMSYSHSCRPCATSRRTARPSTPTISMLSVPTCRDSQTSVPLSPIRETMATSRSTTICRRPSSCSLSVATSWHYRERPSRVRCCVPSARTASSS